LGENYLSNPSDWVVRTLTADDAEKYRPLRLRSLREHPDAFRSSYEEDVHKSIALTRERLAPGGFLGAFDASGEIIGAVGLVQEAGIKVKHIGTVIGMYVVPEMAGKNLGKMLLLKLIERARLADGLEQLVLTATSSNTNALQLYQNAGFEVFGQERCAMKIGNEYFDKTHMILFLSPNKASVAAQTKCA
jgi:RimJ/RimL family protein N-acetyltransferase